MWYLIVIQPHPDSCYARPREDAERAPKKRRKRWEIHVLWGFMTMTTSICTDLRPLLVRRFSLSLFLNKVLPWARRIQMADLFSAVFGTCAGVVLGTTLRTLAQRWSLVIPEWADVYESICFQYFENDKIVLESYQHHLKISSTTCNHTPTIDTCGTIGNTEAELATSVTPIVLLLRIG